MGSTLSPESQIKSPLICKISQAYQEKLYTSNLKTLGEFLKEISCIRRKVCYLRFPWAEELLKWLSATPKDSLYRQYCLILLENSRRDGFGQKIFLAQKLRAVFLREIEIKYACKNTILSPKNLLKMVQEVKSYLMVLGWMRNISTITHSQDDYISHPGLEFQTEEEVYTMMVQAASKTYV